MTGYIEFVRRENVECDWTYRHKKEFSEQVYNRKGIKTNSSLMTPHETENLLYSKEHHHYSKDAA